MAYLFTEFLSDFIEAITHVLKDEHYIIKGGQAILYHMKKASASNDARFSRDIDISFSSESFPIDKDLFINNLVAQYNNISKQFAIEKEDCILRKLPEDESLYFGLRLVLNVHERKENGTIGKKVYFKDIDGLAVVIDFNCGEIIETNYIEFVNHNIKIATIPLIIAEKFRALCSQIENIIPNYRPTPRPKDFFDIFIIINKYYHNNLSNDVIQTIKVALNQCFNKKSMDLKLLNKLYEDNVKIFHESMFDDQVLKTLQISSKYKDVTFDQVYSEVLEFLDELLYVQ
jgi:hypothetical protein